LEWLCLLQRSHFEALARHLNGKWDQNLCELNCSASKKIFEKCQLLFCLDKLAKPFHIKLLQAKIVVTQSK